MHETGPREVNIHAGCVALGSKGVLLLGPSGAGKSDLMLRLIDGGAKLVADDRAILFTAKGVLRARAPSGIRGLMEVRGLGIVEVPARERVTIALAVQLGREGARLPEARFYRPPPPLETAALPPLVALDARHASAPAKIRMALLAFSKGLFRDTFHIK